MSEENFLSSRKSEHIRICLEEDVSSNLGSGLEQYRFIHNALPEVDLAEVDLGCALFGKQLNAPLLISSMTGGAAGASAINRNLAAAAQANGIAMGVGSQRAALEHPETAGTFKIRQAAPDILLLANLGTVQFNYGYTVEHCRRAVDMIEADALILHLNPLQEAVQPEGDTRFSGLLNKIEAVCRSLSVPVVVKEVGWGISGDVARRLASAGVTAIDVAGAGGTSWSQVERHRIHDPQMAAVASSFRAWGIPTAESILQVRAAVPQMLIFASGGLKNGLDVAKCLALGADLGGMAGALLQAASQSAEATSAAIQIVRRELQICLFCTGSANLAGLRQNKLTRNP